MYGPISLAMVCREEGGFAVTVEREVDPLGISLPGIANRARDGMSECGKWTLAAPRLSRPDLVDVLDGSG